MLRESGRKADAAESEARLRSFVTQIAAVSIALCVFDPSCRRGLCPDMSESAAEYTGDMNTTAVDLQQVHRNDQQN